MENCNSKILGIKNFDKFGKSRETKMLKLCKFAFDMLQVLSQSV